MLDILKPGLHSVRRTYATEMRKRIYASHARRGVYTPRVDLGAYRPYADIYAISVAYHFREMDLFYMSRKSLRIRIGCGLSTNDNPTPTRKRRRIVGVHSAPERSLRRRSALVAEKTRPKCAKWSACAP